MQTRERFIFLRRVNVDDQFSIWICQLIYRTPGQNFPPSCIVELIVDDYLHFGGRALMSSMNRERWGDSTGLYEDEVFSFVVLLLVSCVDVVVVVTRLPRFGVGFREWIGLNFESTTSHQLHPFHNDSHVAVTGPAPASSVFLLIPIPAPPVTILVADLQPATLRQAHPSCIALAQLPHLQGVSLS